VGENYLKTHFLAVETLAKRESLALNQLITWCDLNDLKAKRIGNRWFVDLNDWALRGPDLLKNITVGARSTHSPLILLVLAIFLSITVAWSPLVTRVEKGGSLLIGAVSTASQTITTEQNMTNVSSVYDLLWIRLEHLWLKVNRSIKVFANNASYYWQRANDAWRKFVGGEAAEQESINGLTASSTPLLTLDPLTLEALKTQIKSELLRDLGQDGNSIISTTVGNTSGLVILPSSGDPTRDQITKLELQNSFSDQVEVKFDASGQTGIITPIFQNGSARGEAGRGENYLFILTPLKQTP